MSEIPKDPKYVEYAGYLVDNWILEKMLDFLHPFGQLLQLI